MSNDRDALHAAYVIHQRPFRNTSAIVELFTEQHGRLAAVARGARGSRSKWRGVLQAYQGLLVTWRGRGDLLTLTQAEIAGPCFSFAGSRLFSALYLNELVLRLTHRHDPLPELFASYQGALASLQTDDEERALRLFEIDLLRQLGYELVLDRDAASGEPLDPGGRYRYAPGQGLLPCATSGNDLDAWPGHDWLAVARGDFSQPSARRCAKRLTRRALAPLLGGRPLHSRRLFAAFRRRGAAQGGEPG